MRKHHLLLSIIELQIGLANVYGLLVPPKFSYDASPSCTALRSMMEVWSRHEPVDISDTLQERPDAWILDEKDSMHRDGSAKDIRTIVYCIDGKNSLVDSKTSRSVGITLDLKDGQERILAVLGSVEWVMIQSHGHDWQMIPAEKFDCGSTTHRDKVGILCPKGIRCRRLGACT